MRRALPLLSIVLLVAGTACGSGGVETGAPPLSLPAPPDAEGTAPPTSSVGGLAAKLTPSATPEYLRQVGERTRQMATGQVRMVVAAHGGRDNPGGVIEVTEMEGRWDNGRDRSSLRLDPTEAIRAGSTSFIRLLGGPVEMIQIDDVQYLRMGGAAKYTKLDAGPSSALRPIFNLFQISEVGGLLDALGCAGDVHEIGTEALEGVDTRHYRVEAPSAKIKACSKGNTEAGGLLNNLGDSERAQVDVWVDEGSLVRKIVITADEKALGQGLEKRFAGATSVLTMTLSGFGDPVAIDAPPPDQVETSALGLDLGDLFGGGGDPEDPDQLDLGGILSGLG